MEEFFHATPISNKEEIMENGLDPTEASECDCGTGIHVAADEYTARYWCDELSAEAVYTGEGGFDCAILAVTVSDEAVVRADHYRGDFDAEGWVICRNTPIPPSQLTVVGTHPEH